MINYRDWKNISRDELTALYEQLTMPALAARFDISVGAVFHRLRTWGLIGRMTGKRHSPGPKRSFDPPKEELAALYQAMSMREIAKHYGVGETVVFTRIKQAGLQGPTRTDRLTGKAKSPEHKAAIKAAIGDRFGKANPNWKGGVTAENFLARSKPEYRQWKEAVLKNAEYRCQRCGVASGSRCECCGHIIRLHTHHIRHFAKDEAGRHDPANGEALCEKCHHVEHFAKIG